LQLCTLYNWNILGAGEYHPSGSLLMVNLKNMLGSFLRETARNVTQAEQDVPDAE